MRGYVIPPEVARKIYDAQERPANGFHVRSTIAGLEVVYKTGAEPFPLVKLICYRDDQDLRGTFLMTYALEKGTRIVQLILLIAAVAGLVQNLYPYNTQTILHNAVMCGFIALGIYLLPEMRNSIYHKEASRLKRLLERGEGEKRLLVDEG